MDVASKHMVPFPYSDIAGSQLRSLTRSTWRSLSWKSLTAHLSLCRLRARILDLSHSSGKRSSASVRSCTFCSKKTWAPYIHVLGECKHFQHSMLPVGWNSMTSRDKALAFLMVAPSDAHFGSVLDMSLEIDRECSAFWKKSL